MSKFFNWNNLCFYVYYIISLLVVVVVADIVIVVAAAVTIAILNAFKCLSEWVFYEEMKLVDYKFWSNYIRRRSTRLQTNCKAFAFHIKNFQCKCDYDWGLPIERWYRFITTTRDFQWKHKIVQSIEILSWE